MLKRKKKGALQRVVVSDLLTAAADRQEGDGAEKRAANLREHAKEFEGLVVVIEYLGKAKSKEWAALGDKMQMENNRELAKLRRGMPKEVAPELYAEGFEAPGARDRLEKFCRTVLTDCVREVHGVEEHDSNDQPDEHAAVLIEFGLGLVLSEEAGRLQRVVEADSFS
ncbi:MAG: hypothetical protein RMA76_38145 [Deltaproteobacteria bacterium]|jgi:hypothetical protein